MLKKIALFCLASTPIISSEQSKKEILLPAAVAESLKELHQKADKILSKEESARDLLVNRMSANHKDTIGILRARLPHLPRTKIFAAGALAGFGSCLLLQSNNPEIFTYPHTVITRLQKAFDPIQTKITVEAQEPNNTITPDESGALAEIEAEEKAANDSKSCYFR